MTLVDQSGADINFTIWGTKAETFDPSDNPVVCVKGAKVSDFNGVSISALSSSVIQVNPDIAQSHALKGWYESEGESLTTTSLTQARGAGGAGGNMGVGSNLKTMSEVKRENIGFTEDGRPAFYSTSGYIVMFQKDRALYKACNRNNDGKQCNKKVKSNFILFPCHKN
jgi:replication factor A1